jgi:hypothetical protein
MEPIEEREERQENRTSSEKKGAKTTTFARRDCRGKRNSLGKTQRSLGKKDC